MNLTIPIDFSHMFHTDFKWIFLYAAFLLYAQNATLLHAVEHSFHTESAVCQIYIIVQDDSDGVCLAGLQTPISVPSSIQANSPFSPPYTRSEIFSASIRAPPFSVYL